MEGEPIPVGRVGPEEVLVALRPLDARFDPELDAVDVGVHRARLHVGMEALDHVLVGDDSRGLTGLEPGSQAECVVEMSVGEHDRVERGVGLLANLAEHGLAGLLHSGVDQQQPLRGLECDEVHVVGRPL